MPEFPFKPEFGFYQQDFDGKQPELSEQELLQIASDFALAIDRIQDQAAAQNPASIFFDRGIELDEGEFSDFLIMQDQNDYEVDIYTTKDENGHLISQSVVIFWGEGKTSGVTSYQLFYGRADMAVRRTDTLEGNPAGTTIEEGWRQKQEAQALEQQHGFNNQPIGSREMQGLTQYLQTLRYKPFE